MSARETATQPAAQDAPEPKKRRILRRVWRFFGSLMAAAALAVAAAWGYDAYASRRAVQDYPPPGQFVQVGGSAMHVVCQGGGEPSLVLLAGFGGGALDWAPVLPALAERNRTCAFDRFGQDWSDPAPH
ncbi:MAG: hypothetical protein NTZ05_16400, partial [Chloroflexi bacterium]|nr:hypothetical protein [Chloroflexota bacterium]